MGSMVLVLYLISLFLINNNNVQVSPLLVTCSFISSSSSHSNNNSNSSISPVLCHPDESFALLGFKNSMVINYSDPNIEPRTGSWKKGSDCCGWDGIKCHPNSHHVVELNLFNSGLVGTLDSNSSVFNLRHLRRLDLSNNDFSQSTISPKFGSSFPLLEKLELGVSNFSGEVPLKISRLSKLQYLGLSTSPSSNGLVEMKKLTFYNIISNMTRLIELDLGGINIDSTIPPSLTNLSCLQTLDLRECNLRGELPANVLNLPLLSDIRVGGNHDLHANFPLSNWSTSLTYIDLSNVNFSSKLPSSSSVQSQYNKMEALYLRGCSFYGQIPDWVWSISINNNTMLQLLDLSDNMFNGSINLNDFNGSINVNDIHSKFPNVNITLSSLSSLNISHNYLTGRVTSLPWLYMDVLDLSYNMFNGPLPIPPLGVTWFTASNNDFTGSLPLPLCNLTTLQILDLSNNNLKDEVPHCFGNMSYNLC